MSVTPRNSTTTGHCYSCGLQSQYLQRQQYPVCNEKSDSITIEKHWMCIKCRNAFTSIRQFVSKFKPKWFDPQFKIQHIIDTHLLKFSHLQSSSSFVKQSKRKSTQPFPSSSNNHGENSNENEGLLGGDSVKMLEMNLPNDVYSAVVMDLVEKEDYHQMHWLPKTVLYMIQLTQRGKVRQEERRQRVKKTLQVLSYLYCVSQHQLKPLATILHTLYCLMDEQSLLKIADRLLSGSLQNSIPLQLLFIDQVYEVDKLLQEKNEYSHKKPIEFRPDNLLYVIHSIFVLVDYFRDSKLHRHVAEVVHLSHQELARPRQQPSYDPHKSISKSLQNYLKSHISDKSSKLTKLSHTSFSQLLQIKRQRNQLQLIVKTIKREQEENQQIVRQMEGRFKKEKEEYINKIVKLNNHIEELEMEIKGLKEVGSKEGEGVGVRRKGKNLLMNHEDEQVRSNPEIKSSLIRSNTIKDKLYMKPQHITQRTTQVPISQNLCNQQPPLSPTKKHKSQIQLTNQLYTQSQPADTINYLKSILQITDIVKFNQKHLKKSKKQPPPLQLPSTLNQLSQLIIVEINQLEKRVSVLMTENKKLKDQSTRLLAILKRKEESWVPLFQEKDDIISLYENALLCLQRGFVPPQQPLRSRIQLIVQKVSSLQFINQLPQDDTSNRDTNSVLTDSVIDDDLGDQYLPPTKLQATVSEKNVSGKKQKKMQRNSTAVKKDKQKKGQQTLRLKKKVKKQSQCSIF